MFIIIVFSLFCSFSVLASPCPKAFTPASPIAGKKKLARKVSTSPISPKKKTSNKKKPSRSAPSKKQNISPLEEALSIMTLSQQTTFLAYQQALQSKAKSFLHIAPLLEGNSLVMAYALAERLIKTTRKTKGPTQGQKMAIVAVNHAPSVEPLVRTIEKVALTYSEIMDIEVINWNKGEKDLSLALSHFGSSVVVMTHHKLRQILKNPDSENYDLLSSYLSMVTLRLIPPLEGELTKNIILDLQQNSPAFIYGMAIESLHQKAGFESSNTSRLFDKTHWSYLNTKEVLFQELTFQNSVQGILKQFSAGVQQGELSPWTKPDMIDLSKIEMPGNPLFISESQGKVLNPFYYPLLARRLSPVLKSHRKGVLLAGTRTSAEKLTYFLNETFPEIYFALYNHSHPQEERQDILRDSLEDSHHYIVTVRSLVEIENLPHLSVYIDLNVNMPIADRLALSSPVLSQYPGKTESKIILLKYTTETVTAEDSPTALKSKSQIKTSEPKLPWDKALEKVRKAELLNIQAYWKWQEDNPDMPHRPDRYKAYRKYWQNWDHFFGRGKYASHNI